MIRSSMRTPSPPKARPRKSTKSYPGGVDPLHRLYATPTRATTNSRWNVHQKHEKASRKEDPVWGVDRKALEKANQLKKSLAPPSTALESYIQQSTTNQRKLIRDQAEKVKSQQVKVWGVDESAIQKADLLKSNLTAPSEYLTQPTNATHHQQWLVHQEVERTTKKQIKIWGVDDPYSNKEEQYYDDDNRYYSYSSRKSGGIYRKDCASYAGHPSTPKNSTFSTCSMSLSSNRKRRPNSSPYSFPSSQSYTDYYYTARKRKNTSSSCASNSKRKPVPYSYSPKINNTSFLNRDVVIQQNDDDSAYGVNASVLTTDDHSEWMVGNESVLDDSVDEHNNNNIQILNTPSTIGDTTTKDASNYKVTTTTANEKTASLEKSKVKMNKLKEKLVQSEKKIKDGDKKKISKVGLLKRGILGKKNRQSSRLQMISEDKANPRRLRLKRGKSLMFWLKKNKGKDNIQEDEEPSLIIEE